MALGVMPGCFRLEAKRTRCIVLLVLAVVIGSSAQGQTPNAADAVALEQQGNWQQAAEVWQALAKRNPNDAGAFAALGVDLARQQKYSDAVSAYRKALTLNPRLPGIQLNLGLAEFKQGRFAQAVAPLQKALAADPKGQQARALLGMSYYGSGRFAEAAKHLEIAANADPDNAELRQVLAQSCLWAKNYDCALAQFKVILQLNPDSASAHVLTGEALDGLGRTQEALAEYQEAAKNAPFEPNLNFGLGYLYWKLHQDEDAKAAFERELALDPKHADALAYLGDTELRSGDSEKSFDLLQKAVRLNRDIRVAHVDLGSIYLLRKRYPEALAELRLAVKLDPEQPDAHFRLGRLYQVMGNTVAAKQEFAKVQSIHQKSTDDALQKMTGGPPPLKP